MLKIQSLYVSKSSKTGANEQPKGEQASKRPFCEFHLNLKTGKIDKSSKSNKLTKNENRKYRKD